MKISSFTIVSMCFRIAADIYTLLNELLILNRLVPFLLGQFSDVGDYAFGVFRSNVVSSVVSLCSKILADSKRVSIA